MDATKRYVVASGAVIAPQSDLLSSAAALDYPLFIASDRGSEMLDDAGPIAHTVRESMTRGVLAALDLAAALVAADDDTSADFLRRYAGDDGILELIRSLCESGVTPSDEVKFRVLTLKNDRIERGTR